MINFLSHAMKSPFFLYGSSFVHMIQNLGFSALINAVALFAFDCLPVQWNSYRVL